MPPQDFVSTWIGSHPTPNAPIWPHAPDCGGAQGGFVWSVESPMAKPQKRGSAERFAFTESCPARQPTQSPPPFPKISQHSTVTGIPCEQPIAAIGPEKAMIEFLIVNG